jgi:hypothetical protein
MGLVKYENSLSIMLYKKKSLNDMFRIKGVG